MVRYLGDAHVSDLAKTRRRLIRDQGLLEGHSLSAPASSGPARCTEAEVQRIVQESVQEATATLARRVEALRGQSGPVYDLVLQEHRKRVHKLAVDIAAPSVLWQTQCGWHFASSIGWRFAASASHASFSAFKPCGRCDIPAPN